MWNNDEGCFVDTRVWLAICDVISEVALISRKSKDGDCTWLKDITVKNGLIEPTPPLEPNHDPDHSDGEEITINLSGVAILVCHDSFSGQNNQATV